MVSDVARFAILNGHPKYTCYNEIGQYGPSILAMLGSIVNPIGRGLCDRSKRKISYTRLHLNHGSKFEMTIFVIHNY